MVITLLPDAVLAQGPIAVLEEFPISYVDNFGYRAISGDVVVFDNTVNGNSDIYGYDLSTHTGFRITNQAASQELPDISGDTIVWMDQCNGNWDIYGYDFRPDYSTMRVLMLKGFGPLCILLPQLLLRQQNPLDRKAVHRFIPRL